jgi:orotidine-5'-phosphate decarboxylase
MIFERPKDRICVPLDVSTPAEAVKIVERLGPHVGLFKIGFILLMRLLAARRLQASYDLLREHLAEFKLQQLVAGKLFVDCKLKDIAKTVGAAVKILSDIDARWFNVHADSPKKMIRAAAESRGDMIMFGVTVLTDMDDDECRDVYDKPVLPMVIKFAHRLVDNGAQGIICSPLEARAIREEHEKFRNILIACPGNRPDWSAPAGQVRYTTPFDTISNGADVVIIGDPVINAHKYGHTHESAAYAIAEEIERALAQKGEN